MLTSQHSSRREADAKARVLDNHVCDQFCARVVLAGDQVVCTHSMGTT